MIVAALSFAAYIYFKGIPSYDPPQIKEFTMRPTQEKNWRGAHFCTNRSSCHMGKDSRLSGGLMKTLMIRSSELHILPVLQITLFMELENGVVRIGLFSSHRFKEQTADIHLLDAKIYTPVRQWFWNLSFAFKSQTVRWSRHQKSHPWVNPAFCQIHQGILPLNPKIP